MLNVTERISILKSIIYFICIIYLLSCKNNQQESQVKTIIKPDSNIPFDIHLQESGNEICPISLISKNIEYIPLETVKESFFDPRNVKVRFNDSLILLSDGSRILEFNRKGKFIRKIGKTGKGPGEYLKIFNFDLNKDTLYYTSSGTKAVTKYSLRGEYLGSVNLKSQVVYF